MAQLQVILKGENWKRRILVCLLLCVLGLVILEIWNPGTMAAAFAAVKKAVIWIYDYGGTMMASLQKRARDIGGLNR